MVPIGVMASGGQAIFYMAKGAEVKEIGAPKSNGAGLPNMTGSKPTQPSATQ